ncbi:MAG: PQQ-binding-like beta-propeller repeat protein [Planctomycetaceae bacterium]
MFGLEMSCRVLFASGLLLLSFGCADGADVARPVTSSDVTAIPTSAATDWPGFRGVEAMGVANHAAIPAKWSSSENVVWKTALPGAGASSPIVLGDHIYLTSYTGYLVPGEPEGSLDKLQRHLLCLNRENGNILWQKSVAAKLPEEERIRDHGYAANTPAADSERVYTFFGKSGVFAWNHDGDQLWQADVGSKTHGWGTAASPLLYGDLVIINASVESESLIALDRKTGVERWRAGGIKESWNTPIIVKTAEGAEELVVAIQGKVLGFDPQSGKALWTCNSDITWYMVPCGVAKDGVVYYLGGRSGVASLAVRTGGRGDVTKSHRLWTSNKGSNVSSPVYHDGHLYWMHDNLGIVYCAKADSGELVYEKRMERGGQSYASSVLADGRVYYMTRSGKMFVVAATPDYQLVDTNDLRDGGQFDSTPAVTGNRLLIRSDKALYCIGD